MKAHQVRGESCWENGRGGGGRRNRRDSKGCMIATTVASMTRVRMGRGIQKAQTSPSLLTPRELSVGDKTISH